MMFKFINRIFRNNRIEPTQNVEDKNINNLIPEPTKEEVVSTNTEDSIIEITELSKEDIEYFVNSWVENEIYFINNPIKEDVPLYYSSIDISERDAMFREAAEIIVINQKGSASLLQRKLKLGYNRAGRLIDQLEATGIIGPFEGSKERSVNIPDLESLNVFLAEKNHSDDLGEKKHYSKESLFMSKYYPGLQSEIKRRVEEYRMQKEDNEEKERIKKEYLERERKRRLKEEARKELISEGHINSNSIIKQDDRRITQKVKDMVWNRDNGKCVECGSNEKLEFDHIIPFSKGGSNTYRNIQLLCEKCNREKYNKIG